MTPPNAGAALPGEASVSGGGVAGIPSPTPGIESPGRSDEPHPDVAGMRPSADPSAAEAQTPLDSSAAATPTADTGPLHDTPPSKPEPALPGEAGLSDSALADGIDTHLGGLLYLINLMVTLDLPAAFEDDWLPPAAIGPWGVLDAIGRGLLAAEGAAPVDDPIWLVLASLDQREPGELPGAALTLLAPSAPPPLHIPPAWQGRLRSEPETITPLTGPLMEGLHPRLLEWLTGIVPYLQAHLDELLPQGLPLLSSLIRLHARLYVTSSHVDLVARMGALSMPVRTAGLDRNPGWLPHFGRVVLFHFK